MYLFSVGKIIFYYLSCGYTNSMKLFCFLESLYKTRFVNSNRERTNEKYNHFKT